MHRQVPSNAQALTVGGETSVRAFISLRTGDLFGGAPGQDGGGIEALEAALKGAGATLRFVKSDARHMTLRFFGDLESARASEVGRAVAEVAKRQRPFPVASLGVGFFPNAVRPRVVWVGVEDRQAQLPPLHRALAEALRPLGLEGGEEAFVPHITIARVSRAPPGPALADALDPFVHARFGASTAAGLDFIESTLKAGGPVYRTAASHAFAAGGP
jgi:2'-5' RNA ligase